MSFAALAAVVAVLDILLGVIPSAAGVGHEDGHQDAGDQSAGQHAAQSAGTQQEANGQGSQNSHDAGNQHLLQSSGGGDGHAGLVVRLAGAFHDAGDGTELSSYFFNHFKCSFPYGLHCECREQEGQHTTDQQTDDNTEDQCTDRDRKCDFQKSIEVFDYINNQNIIIELDPIKTLNENAQRYFKLYTKSKMTKEKSKEMLENLNMEKDYLENILYSINNAVEIKDFEDVKADLGIDEIKPKKQEQSALMKYEIKGFDVYVGRNNRQNDYIISKLAKDEDYWFHARLCAGSHVLLKTMGREPEEEVLFECCKLARQYSSASLPSKVGIIYTKAKNLRKPPAAPPGYVTYKNEKEVLV